MHEVIDISGPASADGAKVLTREALAFVGELEARFGPTRATLLERRRQRDAEIAAGKSYGLLAETEAVRRADWKVAPAPADLERRHVEITGPVERKMMINALNSRRRRLHGRLRGLAVADVGQRGRRASATCIDAVRRTLAFTSPEGKALRARRQARDAAGAAARLAPDREARDVRRRADVGEPVRLRPLLLPQRARAARARQRPVLLPAEDGEPPRGAAVERRLRRRAGGARRCRAARSAPPCSIETLPAAFEMDEILYELRDHASGLNAGRWDYLFSAIKKLRDRPGLGAPGSRAADDDGAVHARLHRAAGPDLPPPRRARDGRHGAVHPEPQEPRDQRGRAGQGARRQAARGRATASTAPGSRTPTWSRPPREVFDARARRRGRTRRTSCARRSRSPTPRAARPARAGRQDHRGRRAQQRRASRCSTCGLARRQRRGRDLQPDGGRRDRRDLARPALAVDPPRRHARRRAPGDRGALPDDPRRRGGQARRSAGRGAAARGDRASSTASSRAPGSSTS